MQYSSCLLSRCLRYLFPGRKTKMSNCIISLPVPTVVEKAMVALPLLVIYVFNQDELDLFLKMC